MNIVIMHHHLRKGGVTDTIYRAISSLLAMEDVHTITLISATHPEKHHPLSDMIQTHNNLTIHIVPAIHYINEVPAHITPPAILQAQLLECFEMFHSESAVWWVHNHNLGKNPIFTRVLMDFLETHTQATILQIHDFSEAARFDNMLALEQELPLSATYKNSPHTIFTTINSHDHTMLNEAQVHNYLLPNIVPVDSVEATHCDDNHNAQAYHSQIKKNICQSFPQYIGAEETGEYITLFTYPVRCIRRKNVIEAALISKLYEQKFNQKTLFCITLEGVSESEQAYSHMVESLFQNNHIRGFFNIGNSLDTYHIDFNDVCKSSDLIISSSTQEGFGFSFLSAVGWEVPLLARNINVSEDIIPVLRPHWNHHWYDAVLIPTAVLEKIEPSLLYTIRSYYEKKIDSLSHIIPHNILDKVETTLAPIKASLQSLCQSSIDFSFLPVSVQVKIIQQEAFLEHIISANTALLEHIHTMTSSHHNTSRETLLANKRKAKENITKHFGEKTFQNIFQKLCSITIHGEAHITPDSEYASQHIKQKFFSLTYIRALYDTMSYI